MNKKVLLILPRNERGFWGKVTNGKAGFVRLSLSTVAALTPPDWEVTIHDARAHPVDYNCDVGLVGITAFSAETPSAYEIAAKFRAKDVPVVMGGVHATAMPDEALEHVDAVVIGEAEDVWETLLRDLENGQLKRKYKADTLCDMQNMKIPRRDLLDRDMYVSVFNTIQATRGCPFDCEYCAVTQVFGHEFRMRPVSHVIDEIRTFDTRDFMFVDDNICGNPRYAKELFRALIPLKKIWGAQTSITFARDDELLDLYAKAGGRYAFIGFESISEENLALMNKKWNKANSFAHAIDKIHDAGVNILGSFILGLDGDDTTAFKRTLDFIMEHNIDAAEFHILTPLPGTRLTKALDEAGRITDKDWAKYTACEVVFEPKLMTQTELANGFYRLWHDTYTIPRILKRSFRSLRGIPLRLALNFSYRRKCSRMPRP
ncbi:MAG: B12-binding domain-containing radical SAM protein [Candidatus Hydrogenedentes bacterium]|nr:B12-binding domain-containing radical SAM protein [Candidatus Hydrogenedentota bacterium]